jgi:hypothetical protein
MEIVKSVAAKPPTAKPFEVSYRIGEEDTAEGTAKERYDALIARLKTLPAAAPRKHFADKGHIATSSWIVRSSDATPADLGRKLARGLNAKVDILDVMRVEVSTRFEFGDASRKPQSAPAKKK